MKAPVDGLAPTTVWVDVCAVDDLVPDRGVCALVGGAPGGGVPGRPTATLFALSNFDPFSGAFVLSRGIVGRGATG